MSEMKVVTKQDTKEKAIEERRKRAAEAIASGAYKVERLEKGKWVVRNGDRTYTVTVQDGKPVCGCPDFQKRGAELGTCKHIEMVKIVARSTKPASSQASAPSPASQTPNPAPAPTAQATAPAQAEGPAEDPGGVVVHWGRHKGKTLAEVAQEAPGFLAWLAFKMEVRSDEDRKLQQAARRVYDRIKKKGQGGAARGKAANPAAELMRAAAIEIIREAWAAQANGHSPEAIRTFVRMRLQVAQAVISELEGLVAGR
ncbi:SWIM zinc finger family protein [Thermoflexus sp.]|uniref:SWIM zinc finger family protein n=1 Tax=Thermoflexus sp. TaxID=1969742 RepID=UPI002ADE5961|nr:SWIM zinc finger family protein [Thermoflexus sp.]